MFWQSSNNRHYDSSDSSSSVDTGTTSFWSRSKQSPKHSKRPSKPSQPSSSSSSWLPQWMTPDPPPPPPKRSHQRHRKRSKARLRNCRPKSKHGWGFLFLAVLVILYLVDFFKILHSDPLAKASLINPSVKQSITGIGSNFSNSSFALPSNASTRSTTPDQAANDGTQNDGILPGIPEPNPERPISENANSNSLSSSSSSTSFDTAVAPAPGGPSALSERSVGSSSSSSSNSWTDSIVKSGDSSGAVSAPDVLSSSSGTSLSQFSAQKQIQREWNDPMSAPSSASGQQTQPQAESMVGGNQGSNRGQLQSQTQDTNSNGVSAEELVRHPMNRNIPELFVPANTGILSINTVKDYYRQLAKSYLSTFRNGIYRQLYFDILRRRTYALTPPGANKGIQSMLFQIIGGRVYLMDPYEVPRNSKPFYRTRINEVIWLLSKLATEGRLKNTEFLMSIHDCVQTVNQPHNYRGAHYQESNPSFTIVSCNFSNNIPFPMWEGSRNRDSGFSSWDAQMKAYAHDEVPWNSKAPKAVFRGGNRPSMYFRNKTDADAHCNDVGRTRLMYLSRLEPSLLDVSIGGSCGGVKHVLDRLEPRDHHKFKYILYAEGNCMWADRTRLQVFGPSLLIKQETPCGQFFEPLLKPFTHYLPTDFFFTDTIDRIKWAREHEDEARAIVTNANEFANNFLSLRGIEAYVEVLLEEYTALLVEPDVKLETGAIDVTNKQV